MPWDIDITRPPGDQIRYVPPAPIDSTTAQLDPPTRPIPVVPPARSPMFADTDTAGVLRVVDRELAALGGWVTQARAELAQLYRDALDRLNQLERGT